MHATIRLGRIFGIQIGLHYSWLIIAVLVAFSLAAQFRSVNAGWGEPTIWATAILTAVLFFVAIILHELSHAVVAKARGLPVRSRWLGETGETRDYTFADLRNLSNRFANVLQQLGVTRGEKVYVLAGRIPELYITALGTLKNRSVFCPLFSAFGPEPIRSRMAIGQARVLVTTASLYERKVAALRESLPNLKHIILVGTNQTGVDGTLDFQSLMDESSDDFTIGPTDPEAGCFPLNELVVNAGIARLFR